MTNKRFSFLFVVFLLAVLASSSFAKNSSSEKYGFMKDSRDGQIYKTVQIGNQVWMAENLNYKTHDEHIDYMPDFWGQGGSYDVPTSYCFDDDFINCTRYGRLYAWEMATQVCPEGWHLPTRDEWDTLMSVVGGDESGKSLKSTTGWFNGKNGTDAYGFSALPVGMMNVYGTYGDNKYNAEGRNTFFWSSTELDSNDAYGVYLYYYKNKMDLVPDYRKMGGSVRCIKDKRETKDERVTKLDSKVSLSSLNNAAVGAQHRTIESMTDSRDGQIYKTVQIGNQVWMAENLNYKVSKSYCYENKVSNCAKYGRLYAWNAVMDCNNATYPVQGVCPSGWHLPENYEWELLLKFVGRQSPSAGKALKSRAGWFGGGDGTDDFGFSAIPAGFRYGNGKYSSDGRYALFWSPEPYLLKYNNNDGDFVQKGDGLSVSVRCVKNVPKETMTDSRDGQTYKTVKIGSQTWMAENLNYKTEYSSCPGDADSNCVKFGREYTWASAMGIPESFNGNDENCNSCEKIPVTYPVQGVCPVGWHLPTEKEWDTLIHVVGGSGKALKSRSGWATEPLIRCLDCSDFVVGNGSDYFGFGAQATDGYNAGFWTSVGNYETVAYHLLLNYRNHDVNLSIRGQKTIKHSVRCVKDTVLEKSVEKRKNDILEGGASQILESRDSTGFVTDSRDGQTYKTVKIGSQTWMAENLNYKTDYSSCYDDDSSNCARYGRLYPWPMAINACPVGYHLPNTTEWNTLFEFVGGRFAPYGKKLNVGGVLKSAKDWNNGVNSTDSYGFSVLPAGEAYYYGTVGYGLEVIDEYKNKGANAIFWSSSENGNYKDAFYIKFDGSNDALKSYNAKEYVYSVRCLKDSFSGEGKVQRREIKGERLVDSRDGKKYKTVKIGSQTWMAENLNYKTEKSSCNKNADSNCTKFGRFYEWAEAMNACPVGYHLPDTTEWKTLFATVGGQASASKVLKSKSLWKTCENWNWQNGNGTDDYGFSVLPSDGGGKYASFWSSSANNGGRSGNSIYYVYMVAKYSYAVYQSDGNKSEKRSIRCVKD